MTESLESMVTDFDQNEEIKEEKEISEEIIENQQPVHNRQISITNLSRWFPNNVQNFDNIFTVNAILTGVDPDKNLIIMVQDQDNSNVRHPFIFRNSDTIPVLDLPASSMFVFQNNTFQINYILDEIVLITYSLKAGISVCFCYIEKTDGLYVPISIKKFKKFETRIEVPQFDSDMIEKKLEENGNMENAVIYYRQLQKFRENINTNRDIVKFFNNRKSKIQDVNHLMQIDYTLSKVFEHTQ